MHNSCFIHFISFTLCIVQSQCIFCNLHVSHFVSLSSYFSLFIYFLTSFFLCIVGWIKCVQYAYRIPHTQHNTQLKCTKTLHNLSKMNCWNRYYFVLFVGNIAFGSLGHLYSVMIKIYNLKFATCSTIFTVQQTRTYVSIQYLIIITIIIGKLLSAYVCLCCCMCALLFYCKIWSIGQTILQNKPYI